LKEGDSSFGANVYFKHLQGAIGLVKARIFGLAPAEQQYNPLEMQQLAEAIVEYGRMRQEHYGSHAILIGAGEVAMRLRETTHTIVKALAVLKEQGRAEETHVRGRWRLHLTVHAEQEPGNPMCEATSTRN
jgi:hypothetical protein